jgi:hypothetical protein
MDWKGDAAEMAKLLGDAAPALEDDIPGIGPFIPLLKSALSAVTHVKNATGDTTAGAVQQVTMHLTPGMPNSTALAQ